MRSCLHVVLNFLFRAPVDSTLRSPVRSAMRPTFRRHFCRRKATGRISLKGGISEKDVPYCSSVLGNRPHPQYLPTDHCDGPLSSLSSEQSWGSRVYHLLLKFNSHNNPTYKFSQKDIGYIKSRVAMLHLVSTDKKHLEATATTA